MTTSNYNTQWFKNALWIENDAAGTYWVEAGIKVGEHSGGGASTTPWEYFADNRPGYGYSEHWIQSYGLESYIGANIIPSTTVLGNWIVSVANWQATSVDNFFSPSKRIMTGTQAYYDGGHEFSSSSSMEYRNLQGAWHLGWNASSGAAQLNASDPLGAAWMPAYTHLQDGTNNKC